MMSISGFLLVAVVCPAMSDLPGAN